MDPPPYHLGVMSSWCLQKPGSPCGYPATIPYVSFLGGEVEVGIVVRGCVSLEDPTAMPQW